MCQYVPNVHCWHFQPKKKSTKNNNNNSTSNAMIGLVPKATFLKWFRDPWYIQTETATEQERLKELRDRRKSMLYHFSMHGKTGIPTVKDEDGPMQVTRSSTITDNDDWVLDVGAAKGSITDTWCLDRYTSEQIITMPAGSCLLLRQLPEGA